MGNAGFNSRIHRQALINTAETVSPECDGRKILKQLSEFHGRFRKVEVEVQPTETVPLSVYKPIQA
jgi:hypothetical protein